MLMRTDNSAFSCIFHCCYITILHCVFAYFELLFKCSNKYNIIIYSQSMISMLSQENTSIYDWLSYPVSGSGVTTPGQLWAMPRLHFGLPRLPCSQIDETFYVTLMLLVSCPGCPGCPFTLVTPLVSGRRVNIDPVLKPGKQRTSLTSYPGHE